MMSKRLLLIPYNLVLLIFALGLEIYSLKLIFNESESEQILITAFFFHFIACVVVTYIFPKIITSNQNNHQLKVYIFFFVVTFYLPVLGLIGLVLAIPFLMHRSSELSKTIWPVNLSKIRNLPDTPAVVREDKFVDLHSLYRSRNPDRRLQAIYGTLKIKDQDAIPLLRMALRDSVDDIRLIAYALLDRKEHKLSERIQESKQKIEKKENSINKHLYRQIANDYWELANLGLAQGETRNYVLNMALKYTELGLKHYPQDLGFCFRYAQILLKLGDYEQAYEQFKKAENLGIEHRKLLIYYAEIAYHRHRYREVKQLMAAIDFPAAYPQLSSVVQFWQKNN
jgi:polysaccharide biosynthesis protein PelE